MNDSPETRKLLQGGKLSQVCPVDCRSGWRKKSPGPEAAGFHCSACGTRTGPEQWRLTVISDAQREARQRSATRRTGARSVRTKSRHGEAAQSLVEFALIFPVLMLAVLGFTEAGFLLTTQAHQDRATDTVVQWAAGHPGEDWQPVADDQLPGCEVGVTVDGDIVTAAASCEYVPRVTSGVLDGVVISSEESAATEPSPTPGVVPTLPALP